MPTDKKGNISPVELLNLGIQLKDLFGKKQAYDYAVPEGTSVDYNIMKPLAKHLQDIKKLDQIRPVWRETPGQEVPESVLLQSIEVDGRYYATPTIFPKDPSKPSSDYKNWDTKIGMYGFEEAKSRDELFEFDTSEEAERFALEASTLLPRKPK
jgi:hypothetical protein